MPRPPADLLPGPEHLLVRRAADRLLGELREEAGGDLEVTEVRGADLRDDALPDLRTASLFATPRAYVVRDAQTLPKAAAKALQAELAGPPPEATIILLASGTGPIQGLAKRIKDLGGRIDTAPPREWEEEAWRRLVTDELRRHDRTATREAVAAILAHAGLNVNTIAEKVAQVAAAVPAGAKVTADQVDELVVGHGSRGSFAVADAMCDRDPATALKLLRGVLEAGDHPVMVLGALTFKLRSLIAVAAGLDPKQVGLRLSAGQAGRLKGVRRNFGPGELTRAMQHLAAADLEIKSGDLSAELAVERAVLAIATRDEVIPVPDPDREILRK